ncbi:hypothetical protein BDZ89DRAFT_1130920 [Hymenopellis radicata]|nr:hypothetical protein BDZ89DRAFT_1130920 [Hymenopellis radicata]
MTQTEAESHEADAKCLVIFYTRFTSDASRDAQTRQCPKCRQGTVAAVVSRNYIKIYKPVILSSRKIWRCTNCSWKAGLNARIQPPIVARPFSLQAVKEINPMHLVSESWHRPPSIVERQPLSLPAINLTN